MVKGAVWSNDRLKVPLHWPVSASIILVKFIAWWRHQIETFSAVLAICAGNSPVPGEFPAQRPVTRSLMFSLICVWINGWVNNSEAGDLRRHRAHYDVIVMDFSWRQLPSAFWFNPNQCGPRSPYSVTRPLWVNWIWDANAGENVIEFDSTMTEMTCV